MARVAPRDLPADMSSTSAISVSGLASGVDTDAVIQKLMAVQRRSQTALKLQQSQAEARQSALRDVAARLRGLQGAAHDLRSSSLWANAQTVQSTDPARVQARASGTTPPGGYQIEVSGLARAAQRSFVYTPQDLDTEVTIGATTISIPAGADVTAVAVRINAGAQTPVYATVVGDVAGGQQRLVLSSRLTGAANGFTAAGPSLAEDPAGRLAGADTVFTVDGVEHRAPTSTVTDAIPGLQLTLQGITSTPVSVSAGAPSADLDAVKAKLHSFVEQYNAAVSLITSRLSETRVSSPQSDTDAARGVLQNDGALKGLLGQLRLAVSTLRVDGSDAQGAATLADLGISTGAVSPGAINPDALAGKLVLDESKLATALQTSVSAVQTALGASLGGVGLIQKLDALLDPVTQTGGTLDTRISAADGTVRRLAKSLTAMGDRLQKREEQLRRQFTAMETSLSRNQSRAQWLSGQIAALENNTSRH